MSTDLKKNIISQAISLLLVSLLSVATWGNATIDGIRPAPVKGPAAFADEAATIMENEARSRGLNPNSGIVNMAIPRSKILEKIAGKQKGIDYHLDEHIPELIGKAEGAC